MPGQDIFLSRAMTLSLPRPVGTLRFVSAWFVPWRPAFRVRAAQSGLSFHVHHRDTIGRHIAKYGTHEPLVTRWMAEFLKAAERGLTIDIGANLGWHALHAAQNAETVVAFEPDPFNAWLLERNLAENGIGNVVVETRAVGAAPGIATLYRYKSANYGRHSLAADHGHGSRHVAVTDLDGAMKGLGFAGRDVALIKIDVEGYEPAVIAGARDTLTRTAAIILEYSPDLSRAGGLSTADMFAELEASGFAPFVLRAEGGTSRTTTDELKSLAGSLDVIWLRADRQTELASGMNERPRDGLSLAAIAEQNKRIVTPM
jgi:FkbM family methyltransferase